MSFLDKKEIELFYQNYSRAVQRCRSKLGHPLTFTEKIFFAHAPDLAVVHSEQKSAIRGTTDLLLHVDRIAMQDATAQMAILQFMNTGRSAVAVPTTVHCDHLIQAFAGADQDLRDAQVENHEVYQFLKSAANKYGMGFWKPGSGIIHQVILENYAVPGQLMIGTDSHTPNAGGLAMAAIGVGGTDAVDVMAGERWPGKMPKIIGVHLKGSLSGWTAPKDIILTLAELLTVKGGTGCVIEYFGEGLASISATGRATIANMGAEVGATTSVFPYDEKTDLYLRATQREFVAEFADSFKQDLQADEEVYQNPLRYFDELIVLDLSSLQPQIVGPHTPDLGRDIHALAKEAREQGWPLELSSCLIGSCTNSSYEDLSKAYDIAMQAYEQGMKVKVPLLITPGSNQIYQTIQKEGWLNIFEAVGGKVLANACGPCIGQWKREQSGKNSILSSFNRNFKKRNDGNPETHSFIGSPEIVTALAFSGRLDFNPLADELDGFLFSAPQGRELPERFAFSSDGYLAPHREGSILINPNSERLALMEPFTSWQQNDFKKMFVLVKAKGKCTTDHISPAGKWLAYRGHLDRISDNLFSGAVNAFSDSVGKGKNQLTGRIQDFSQIAREYKVQKRGWIVVGDENYGEGSSREHAAMEPRYLGCRAVIAKSFARIAETNLKRQGILPLWFVDKADYEKILEDDLITIDDIPLEAGNGLYSLKLGNDIYLHVQHVDGSIEAIPCRHTFSAEERAWFTAGSALEYLKQK
ncbi:MAG TPA: aconitate hydratase [Candidatus Nanoarchaeia archaeon]|nr:aconitate hydratase [Candidatus Nanoarchaeia archaeon]